MSYNLINDSSVIESSKLCKYDSVRGYSANFSVNGEVDGWQQFSGVHTYGCWNGFLFGTVFKSEAYIGRTYTFQIVPAEFFYTLRIVMKVSSENTPPTMGRIMWRTLSDPSWSEDKTVDFKLHLDNDWHTYTINMSEEQWWQGDINDLRLYPAFDSVENNPFFIRAIQILSVSTYKCTNGDCDYFLQYQHNCSGAGAPATCSSKKEIKKYNITKDVDDELLVNINGYGFEEFKLPPMVEASGTEIAVALSNVLSILDIGGYVEAVVSYDVSGIIIIKSGTYTNDSSVEIGFSPAAIELGFFDVDGIDISIKTNGRDPASGFQPQCSIRLKSFQISDLFDNDKDTYVDLHPFDYGVEGGRRDYVTAGLGRCLTTTNEDSNRHERVYNKISNYKQTIIDFSHPFNNSGRVVEIIAGCSKRLTDEYGQSIIATGCKIKIFRPRKDGTYVLVHDIDIPDTSARLLSNNQEFVFINCDIQINKGDVIGFYNLDVYIGTTKFGIPDAKYVQVGGDCMDVLDPNVLSGNGVSGFIIYAHGDYRQERLVIDIDLGCRYNLEDVIFEGEVLEKDLEFNIARCLDVSWEVDLLGGTHTCGYKNILNGLLYSFIYNNMAYGLNRLSDGDCINKNGVAAEDFSYSDSGGFVSLNPSYFYVNGDQEWLEEYLFSADYKVADFVADFDEDPIIFYLTFPYNIPKYIKRSTIYFKEYSNFRSFSLSYLSDLEGKYGNTDDKHYTYIPKYSSITLDNIKYHENMGLYERVKEYLFANPCDARPIYGPRIEQKAEILNYTMWAIASTLDWTTMTHEWDPILGYGFRIRCDFHKSTKINEIEVFCVQEDVNSSLADSIRLTHTSYKEFWTDVSIDQDISDSFAKAFIGDSPRYLNLDIELINDMRLKNVKFTFNNEALFFGEKGCEYSVIANNSKMGVINESQELKFINTFECPYDLYVDIVSDSSNALGTVFNSTLSSDDEILNPVVGPSASYSKYEDCPLVGQNKNCAINCDCYGLNSISNGASIYYRNADVFPWIYSGVCEDDVELNLGNLSKGVMTKYKIPPISRNRYWKFKFPDIRTTEQNVYEVQIFFEGKQLSADFFWFNGTTLLDASYLKDNSNTGDYCVLNLNKYILIDLGEIGSIDEIIFFQDCVPDGWISLHSSQAILGVDTPTVYYVSGESLGPFDYSYYKHPVVPSGPGVSISSDVPSESNLSGSLHFDGIDTLVTPNHPHFNMPYFSVLPFVVECYVKFDSIPVVGDIAYFLKLENSPTNHSLVLALGVHNSGDHIYLRFWINNSVVLVPEYIWDSVTADTWYHVAYVRKGYNGGGYGATFYINGVSVASNGTNSTYWLSNSTGSLVLGSNFKGNLCNVRYTNNYDRGIMDSGSFPLTKNKLLPYYGMDVLVSDDGLVFGDYAKVDDFGSTAHGYYYSTDNFRNKYTYSEVLFNLTKRHDIDFMMNYGPSALETNAGRVNFSSMKHLCQHDLNDRPDYISDDLDYTHWQSSSIVNWIIVDLGVTSKRSIYAIGIKGYASSSSTDYTEHMFKDFKIFGSNNVFEWTELFSGVAAKTVEYQVIYFGFETEPYRYFRINTYSNYGGSSLLINSVYFIGMRNYIQSFSNSSYSDPNALVFDSSSEEVKWLKVSMRNGDGVSKNINKLKIYPNISTNLSPDGVHNCDWTYLGNSVTAYSSGKNIAFNTTVSGSDQYGDLYLGRIIDGYKGENPNDAWGSNKSAPQWVEIDLGEVKSIYRIKVFHGYNSSNTLYMNTSYTIEASTDCSNYVEIFDISGNSSLERTHDLSSPIDARWIKLTINSFNADRMYILNDEGFSEIFEGMFLREIEVYEYYGYEIINSEEWPVIAINLKDQFYIERLNYENLIGVNSESTATDWIVNDDSFFYSDSVLSSPEKIRFLPPDVDVLYKQWVVIKNYSATNLNNGPDYLKNVLVKSIYPLNSCEYSWWWDSILSTCVSDPDYMISAHRSLRIDYPTSSGSDNVRLLEGDTFGIDVDASWRDGLNFHLYLPESEKLDTNFGYFHFGNPSTGCEFRWYINTLYNKGFINRGWNNLFLCFKDADDFISGPNIDPTAQSPAIVYNFEFKNFGVFFRGVGESFSMNIDGFKIERNIFREDTYYNKGLYLHKSESLKTCLSQIDFSKFALEFFIRPDFNAVSRDAFFVTTLRNLFSFSSIANDVVGCFVFGNEVGVYFGNLADNPSVFYSNVSSFWTYDDVLHFAFVISNDGTGMDNGDTIRFYINNELIGATNVMWEIKDDYHFEFYLGGRPPYVILSKNLVGATSLDSVVSNLKIYNYCKTDYSDSLAGVAKNRDTIIKPNELIEISKDNLTFYSMNSKELPFLFKEVPVGDEIPIYIRTKIPKRQLKGIEKRTAGVIASWDVGV